MTQLDDARQGRLTAEMAAVAEDEGLPAETVRAGVAGGRVVIPKNVKRRFAPMGIGEGLSTKVNANIGTSPSHHDLREELAKLERVPSTPGPTRSWTCRPAAIFAAIRRADHGRVRRHGRDRADLRGRGRGRARQGEHRRA